MLSDMGEPMLTLTAAHMAHAAIAQEGATGQHAQLCSKHVLLQSKSKSNMTCCWVVCICISVLTMQSQWLVAGGNSVCCLSLLLYCAGDPHPHPPTPQPPAPPHRTHITLTPYHPTCLEWHTSCSASGQCVLLVGLQQAHVQQVAFTCDNVHPTHAQLHHSRV